MQKPPLSCTSTGRDQTAPDFLGRRADRHPLLTLPPARETASEAQFFSEKEKVFLIAPNASVSPWGASGLRISMITQNRPAFSVMT